MNIQLAGPPQTSTAPAPSRLSGFRPRGGSAPRGGGRGGSIRGGRGGGRGGLGRTPGQKKPEKSAADLDADLDAYNAKMQTD